MDIVKNNEPLVALYAKNKGLEYYESIFKNINNYLNEDYLIALEIGETQGQAIKKIIKKNLPNAKIKIEQDMQSRDRFIFVSNKPL